MGDRRNPELVKEQPANGGAQNAGDKLRQDAQLDRNKVTDKTQVTDTKAQRKSIDPFANLQTAQAAANEVVMYFKGGKQPTDKVQIKYADGSIREVTVGDRVKELKGIIKSECEVAIGAADRIKQTSKAPGETSIATMIQDNNARREKLAIELGMLPAKISAQDINDRLQKSSDGSAERQKLEQLKTLQTQREKLEGWKNASAYTRTFYAMLKSEGMADSSIVLDKLPDGRPKIAEKEIMDSYQLVREAGRLNPDFRNTGVYANADAHVSSLYALYQGDRSQKIMENLQQATQMGRQGKVKEQEALLKAAVDEANKVSLPLIASQLHLQSNKDNPETQAALKGIIVTAANAKLELAQFLKERGRVAEAQPLVNEVKAACPEIIYQFNEQTKTIAYRDESLGQLDNAIAMGATVPRGTIDQNLQKFNDAIQKQDYDSAQKVVDDLYKVSNDVRNQCAESNKVLEAERVKILMDKENLAKRTELSEHERKIEEVRIEKELNIVNNTIEMRNSHSRRLYNQVRLLDADLRLSKAGADYGSPSAAAIYNEIIKNDPDLVKEINKSAPRDEDGKSAMEQRLEAARQKSGWERNWKLIATAGAVTAGLVVAGLTIWSGPGAAFFGAGTTAGLITTMGIATAGGFVAGGLTYHGVHRGLTNDKPDFWGDFKEGGIIGGSTAALVTAAWAGPTLLGSSAGKEAVTAGRMAALRTKAAEWGFTRQTLALGYGSQAAIEAKEVIFDDKSVVDAAKSLSWKGGINAMMFGWAGKFGGTEAVMGRGRAEAMRALVGFGKYKATEEVIFAGMHSLYAGPVMGADGRNPGPSHFLSPPSMLTMAGSDLYQSYSPVTIPFHGRPQHMGLDLANPKDEELFWRRVNSRYIGVDVIDQKKVSPVTNNQGVMDVPKPNK